MLSESEADQNFLSSHPNFDFVLPALGLGAEDKQTINEIQINKLGPLCGYIARHYPAELLQEFEIELNRLDKLLDDNYSLRKQYYTLQQLTPRPGGDAPV